MKSNALRLMKVWLVAVFAGIALAACSGGEAPATGTPAAAPPATGTMPATSPPATPGTPLAAATWPAEANAAVSNAQQALAKQLGATVAAIAVVGVTPHDWPNTALGCEQPGKGYAQVITPGYIIVLAARGTQYTYHADQAGNVVTCSAPTPQR